MKILSIDKDKVQVQLTQKELDAIVFCLEGVLEEIDAEQIKMYLQNKGGSIFSDRHEVAFFTMIAKIRGEFVKTGLIGLNRERIPVRCLPIPDL